MISAKAMIANQKTRLKNNGISVRMSVIQEGLFCFSDSISYISALILYSFCMALSVTVSLAYGNGEDSAKFWLVLLNLGGS